jgi:hypothetical protein
MGHEDNFNLIVKENDNHFHGVRRRADSPDRLAVGMRARNTPIICPEKVILYSKCVPCALKHVSELLKSLFDCSFSSMPLTDTSLKFILCVCGGGDYLNI